MALQVWLPLTKDLRNQGLNNMTFSNTNTTNIVEDLAGKLGKCYKRTAKQTTGRIISNTTINLSADFSMCCWAKVTDCVGDTANGLVSNHSHSDNTGFGITIKQISTSDYRISCNTGTGSGRTYNTYYGTSNIKDAWHHLTITYNKSATQLKLWVDGVCEKTVTYTSGSKADYIVLFDWSTTYDSTNYRPAVAMNDVRIYDHCLSPMEVKQLSQGLVLHYPLNRNGWGQENLVWNSNWNTHSIIPPEGWVNWGSPPTREIVTIDGKNWLHVISNTTQFQGYSQNWTKRNGVGELTANTKMTVSFTAKLAAAASIAPIGIHWCNSSGTIVTQNWTTTALTTSPKRYSFTYTTPADCVAFNIMVGDNTNTAHEVWVTDIKLEFGEIATPWCPNSSDTLATTMGLNSTTEYDCSGFCNNGTRTGTFTWTSDTPKYMVSSIHSGNYIYLTPPSTEIQTMAVWVNWDSIPSGQSVILVDNGSGIGLGLMNTGILCSTSKAGNSYTFSKANLVANTWYHFVVVKTGTTARKLYINGVEQTATSKTSNWSYSVNQLQLGKRSTTSDGFVGKLSDFRAYATALSASDVKSLYQNSAYIDSSGNVYGAVHSEV